MILWMNCYWKVDIFQLFWFLNKQYKIFKSCKIKTIIKSVSNTFTSITQHMLQIYNEHKTFSGIIGYITLQFSTFAWMM